MWLSTSSLLLCLIPLSFGCEQHNQPIATPEVPEREPSSSEQPLIVITPEIPIITVAPVIEETTIIPTTEEVATTAPTTTTTETSTSTTTTTETTTPTTTTTRAEPSSSGQMRSGCVQNLQNGCSDPPQYSPIDFCDADASKMGYFSYRCGPVTYTSETNSYGETVKTFNCPDTNSTTALTLIAINLADSKNSMPFYPSDINGEDSWACVHCTAQRTWAATGIDQHVVTLGFAQCFYFYDQLDANGNTPLKNGIKKQLPQYFPKKMD